MIRTLAIAWLLALAPACSKQARREGVQMPPAPERDAAIDLPADHAAGGASDGVADRAIDAEDPPDSGVEGPGSFTLDLTNLQDRFGRIPLFVQNGAVLVFALDLSAPRRTLATTGPDTIQSVDTRIPCPAIVGAEAGARGVLGKSLAAAQVPRRDTAVIDRLDLEMPYGGTPVMNQPLRPSKLCLGTRRAGGDWTWSFVPTHAVLDDAAGKATARIDFGRLMMTEPVDAVGVLFDSQAFVRTVRFQVRR